MWHQIPSNAFQACIGLGKITVYVRFFSVSTDILSAQKEQKLLQPDTSVPQNIPTNVIATGTLTLASLQCSPRDPLAGFGGRFGAGRGGEMEVCRKVKRMEGEGARVAHPSGWPGSACATWVPKRLTLDLMTKGCLS